MIGAARVSRRSQWLQATALSLALHGAAIGGILYERAPARDGEAGGAVPVLTVETLLAPGGGETAAPVLDPIAPPEILEPRQPDPAPQPEAAHDRPSTPIVDSTPIDTAIVTTSGDMWAVVQPAMPALPTDAPVPALPDEPVTAEPANPDPALPATAPLDPRLDGMIQRIRDKLDESCLLALPQLTGEGQVRLSVLAAADRQISAFVEDVTQGLGDIPDRRVLLDRRQCPGLTFARRAADYPVFALQVQLQDTEIDSGGAAIGRIVNGAGHYNTLLLVDDNGVVQDLRRFLTVQGGEVGFDVPMSREGASRDTNQLLIAIATPGRIDSVTRNAGRLAADFFPDLIAELGDDVLIGVTSIYVR